MLRFRDDSVLTACYRYWNSLPGTDGVPDRRDLDPVAMPKSILPHLVLVEFVDDNTDGIVRLAGDAFNAAFGSNVTGKRLTDVTKTDYREYIVGHIDMLVRYRLPLYSESTFRWNQGGQWRTRRLMTPLSNGMPGAVQMWFAAQTFPVQLMHGRPFWELVDNSDLEANGSPAIINEDGA